MDQKRLFSFLGPVILHCHYKKKTPVLGTDKLITLHWWWTFLWIEYVQTHVTTIGGGKRNTAKTQLPQVNNSWIYLSTLLTSVLCTPKRIKKKKLPISFVIWYRHLIHIMDLKMKISHNFDSTRWIYQSKHPPSPTPTSPKSFLFITTLQNPDSITSHLSTDKIMITMKAFKDAILNLLQ